MATQEKTWNVANRLHSLKDSDNPEVNHIIAGADEIYDDAKGAKQSDINAQTDAALADRYTKAETYSKEQLDALITTPDVNHVSVVATNATTAVTDILPATGEANTIYRVGNWNGTQYDTTMYALYAWNGSAYVCLAVRSFVGEVYDISANHPDGQGNPTPYADLTAALGTGGANIPADIRSGGMRIQFIQGTVQSSDNKYVQYFLIKDEWSATDSDWQKLNLEEEVNQLGQEINGIHPVTKNYDNTQLNSANRIYNKISLPLSVTSVKVKADSEMESKPQLDIYYSADGANWTYINSIGSSQYGNYQTYTVPNTVKFISLTSANRTLSGTISFTVNVGDVNGINDRINNLDTALEKRVAVNKVQSFTDAEKAQGLMNLGINGVDTTPVVNSDKLITSGGVEKELYKIGNELNGVHAISQTYNNSQLTYGNRTANKVRLQVSSTSVSVKAESPMETKPTLTLVYSTDGQSWTYFNAIGSSQYGNVYTFTIPDTAQYISLYSSDSSLTGDILLSVSVGESEGVYDRLHNLEQDVQEINGEIGEINDNIKSKLDEFNIDINGFHQISKVFDVQTLKSANRTTNKIDLIYPVETISFEPQTDIVSPPTMHIYKSADGTNWSYINDIGSSQYNRAHNFTIDTTIKYISFYVDTPSSYTGNIEIIIEGAQVNGLKDNVNFLSGQNALLDDEVGLGVPSYYQQHIDDKLLQIFSKYIQCAQNGDTFIFITDTHIGADRGLKTNYNYGHSGNLIRYINNNVPINRVIHGGDMIDGGYYLNGGKRDFMKVYREFSKIDWIGVVGNHDTNASGAQSPASYFTNSDIYGNCIKNAEKYTDTNKKNYYYIDNESQKIRYVFLDLHWDADVDQRGVSMDTAAQLSWLDTISSELDSTWNMLFFAHIIFNSKTYVEDYVFEWHTGSLANQFISKIDTIAADVNKPTVIGIISGHTHYDYDTVSSEGYPIICSCDDAYWGYNAQGGLVKPASYRVEGTASEQSFDVVSIDTANRKIYMTKIGYGSDREFSY